MNSLARLLIDILMLMCLVLIKGNLESEAKYRDVFETVQEVFYIDRLIYDEEGNVVDWIFEDLNPAGFDLLGLKDIDDAKGKRGSEVLGREVASFYLPMIEKARRSSKAVTFQYHSPYVDKDFLTSYIVRGDRLISAQMDVTELKQAEETLREAYENLQVQSEELQAQSEELQVQNEELQSQSEELQMQSEELQKPMKLCGRAKSASIRWLTQSHSWLGSPNLMATSTGITSAGMLTPAPRRSRWKAGAGRVFTTLKCCQKYWSSGRLRLLRGRCLIWSSLCAEQMVFSVRSSHVFCL